MTLKTTLKTIRTSYQELERDQKAHQKTPAWQRAVTERNRHGFITPEEGEFHRRLHWIKGKFINFKGSLQKTFREMEKYERALKPPPAD